MLRVIQWATGNVGRHAAGPDVGELCGLGPIGIAATTDRDAIAAIEADCVLSMPQGEMDPMAPSTTSAGCWPAARTSCRRP